MMYKHYFKRRHIISEKQEGVHSTNDANVEQVFYSAQQ